MYRYAVSLRFRHPGIDPREITAALGLKPSTSWRADDPRTTPTGRPLGGTRRETYWTCNVAEGGAPPDSLANALHAVLDTLEPHKALFARKRAEGGRAEFFIGWYIKDSGGEDLDQTLLRRLVEMQIDLGIDSYYDPELPDDE